MSNVVQRSFAAGELAPALYARTDQTKYATGLRTLRNARVLRHGGIENRPGSRFITEVKDSSKKVRLIKFVYDTDTTYVLEFGEFYMRVVKNTGQVHTSSVAAWSGATAYAVGDTALSGGIVYYCILAHTNHIPPNVTYWYPMPGTVYEIPTPYLAADLPMLRFTQSVDIITLTSRSYAPRNLLHYGDAHWALVPEIYGPTLVGPAGLIVAGGSAGGPLYWAVTSIASDTFEESLYSYYTASNVVPSAGTPSTVSWTAVTGAQSYNVYRSSDGVSWGFIGASVGTSFLDVGLVPDTTITPPIATDPFPATGTDYPLVVGYYQQRKLYGNTIRKPEKVWGSRSADFNNMNVSSPSQEDDAISFTLAGKQVSAIKHFVDFNKLLILTSGSIWSAEGNADGVLLPTAINAKQRSYHGVSDLAPLVVGTNLLYVQSRATIVRNLLNDALNGIVDTDLTIFSTHLFENYSILDWDASEIPNPIVYIIRSDGTLLGLTYLPEQQVAGWHRHDTDGVFENVCVVPEGLEDRVYVVVNRTINGATKRYIECFETRLINDIRDACFMDSQLVYDGRNTDMSMAGVIGLVNGSTWDNGSLFELSANSPQFTAADIGNAFFFYGDDGTEIRCTIETYTSTTHVHVRPNRTVPLELRDTGVTVWSRAVDALVGLDHLIGKTVSVFADGFVVGSPLNESVTPIVVAVDGTIQLDKPYAVIHVGLPYISDIQTLDIDTPQGPSMKDKKMNLSRVDLSLYKTRGLFVGQGTDDLSNTDPTLTLLNMEEIKARDLETYDEPVDLATDVASVTIESDWNSKGRISIRQVDPVPLTILSVIPQGYIPSP